MKREMALGTFGASPRHLAHAAQASSNGPTRYSPVAAWAVNILRRWVDDRGLQQAELGQCRYALERLRRLTNDPTPSGPTRAGALHLLGGLEISTRTGMRDCGPSQGVPVPGPRDLRGAGVICRTTDRGGGDRDRAKVMGVLSLGTGFPTPCGPWTPSRIDFASDGDRRRVPQMLAPRRTSASACHGTSTMCSPNPATCHYRAETRALIPTTRRRRAAAGGRCDLEHARPGARHHLRPAPERARPRRSGDAIGAPSTGWSARSTRALHGARSADTSDLDDRIKTVALPDRPGGSPTSAPPGRARRW